MEKVDSLVFGMCFSHESPDQLRWCLKNIRMHYPETSIFVIGDGVKCPDFCKDMNVDILNDKAIKGIQYGAMWWERFIEKSLSYNTERFIKLDPDTKINRRLNGKSEFDFSGTKLVTPIEHIQGGFQCFTRLAGEKILESGYCRDSLYKRYDKDLYGHIYARDFIDRRQMSTDFTIISLVKRLGISWGDWDEIDSWFGQKEDWKVGVAVTHPHKNDWKNNRRKLFFVGKK